MHVIFFCPHFPASQRRFVRGLKAVGARVTGLGDAAPEHVDSEVLGLLDAYEHVPHLGDEDALVAAVKRIQARGPWVHHLEATIESHMLLVARVRERTGIPGQPAEVVERCRDKFLMKQYLRARGVPCARNAVVSTAEDARAFVAEVGFPVVLKPRDGAGAHATYRLDDPAGLERALAETGLLSGRRYFTMEEFIRGHEGFYDTLTVGGEVVYEFVSHYYPGVLVAMRERSTHAMIVSTNRLDAPAYGELRDLGGRVIEHLGISTSATHMEWFYGPKGLSFSEIGARPPGVNFWDVYSAANDLDIFEEWARSICWGTVSKAPSRRFAGGILNLRPTADGTVRRIEGADRMQERYGPHIFASKLPAVGSPTQPISAGYLANGWLMARHTDYDALKAMFEDIGRSVRIVAG